jgi:tripartite-type tricarboxylate transporter receptor subunit TctC
VKDFTPITQIASTPSVLVVNPTFPANTIQEFIAQAKDESQPLNYASPGNGSAQHLAMELLRKKAGLALSHVPYKGGAPAINDLLGGHVLVMFSGMPEVLPHLKAGKLRALAVTTAERSPFLPDVPTLIEVGLADSDLAGWNGLHAPAGTPPEIIDRLNKEVAELLKEPNVQEKLTGLGFQARGGSTPEQFGEFVMRQMAVFREAVEISGARAE